MAVTTRLSSVVFRRPILFIRAPVGIETIRNQKNTIVVHRLAKASESPKSALM